MLNEALWLMQVLVKASKSMLGSAAQMGTILACSDTNAAVDNLVEGFAKEGLRVVRVGHPAKVSISPMCLFLYGFLVFC